jgi:hypothetical protein
MSAAGVPNEAAQKQFVGKLNTFRSSLDADEQRMLDAMVTACREAHEQGDVNVYWFEPLSGTGTQPYGVTTNVWSSYGTPGAQTNTPFSGGTG